MKLLSVLILIPVLSAAASAQDFQSLFNGKDLSGWAGKTEFWSVKDGAIFGETTKDKPTKGNTFLVWQGGDVGDFVFKAKVRFAGNNSGVQYRSELVGKPEDFVAKGYQADLHPKPEFFGMLYAEKWRGIVARRFQRVVVGADGKPQVVGAVGDNDQKLVDTEWNELTIIAVGNRQIHQVNGVTTMDLTDNHPEAKRKGILALQLHAGKPMTVEFKDIGLRHLKGKDAKAAIEAVTEKAGNKATPVERIKVAKGFKAELLYSVPGETQGSWINLCTDNKGRLLTSDQYGGLYQMTPPAIGETLSTDDVQPVSANIRAANGMVWAFGALYVVVNDFEKKMQSGLYRVTDSDGDDQLDKVELLRATEFMLSSRHRTARDFF